MEDPTTNPASRAGKGTSFMEILPKYGLLYSDESFEMVFCKPKILPLKSVTLEKLENMQKQAQEALKMQEQQQDTAD